MNVTLNAIIFKNKTLPFKLLRGSSKRWIFTKSQQNCKERDTPIKFTTSDASSWKAEFTRTGVPYQQQSPWYQPLVVSSSVAIFLIYFCILREENDLDELLYQPLYDRIDGLEESDLKTSIAFYEKEGMETRELKQRLAELKKQ